MKKISVVATNACGWPNLTKLRNGQILCTYFNAPSHGLMEGDLVCSISDRMGLNWIKRGVVAKHLRVETVCIWPLVWQIMEICFTSAVDFVKEEKFTGFSGRGFPDQQIAEKHGRKIHPLKYQRSYKIKSPFAGLSLSVKKLAYSCYDRKFRES